MKARRKRERHTGYPPLDCNNNNNVVVVYNKSAETHGFQAFCYKQLIQDGKRKDLV